MPSDAATRQRRRRQIRNYHEAGLSGREIARRMGLNERSIRVYLRNYSYALEDKTDARMAKRSVKAGGRLKLTKRANEIDAQQLVDAIELVEYLLQEVDVEASRLLFARLERVWLQRLS